MELDDLKDAWMAHGTLLARSLAINERVLRELMLRKVRGRLAPYLAWRALELAAWLAALIAVIPVIGAHLREPRYLVVGGALAGFLAMMAALSAYLLVHGARLDYGGAVTGLQRDVEHIRRAEYRALKWGVLGGTVIWLPAALIGFEVVTGIAALARADLAWLVANLAFGVVVLGLGQALSRRYVERPDLAPWARRLIDAMSGRGLRAAAGHLAELATFEREA